MRFHRVILSTFICASVAFAQEPHWARIIDCEIGDATGTSLGAEEWQQGTTPLLALRRTHYGRRIPAESNVTAVVTFGPSATSQYFVSVTNQAIAGDAYLVQLPTIGTNTGHRAWWYTAYFLRDGKRYWTGNGSLRIIATTSTEDGLHWQEITSGEEADPVALPRIIAATNNLARVAHTGSYADLADAPPAPVESDPVAGPLIQSHITNTDNPHGITAEGIGALTAESDTLATVTARGATTTNAVTIGNRGTGNVGSMSLAQGADVIASREFSHAEGYSTTASGHYSHAEGVNTTASGPGSHAEGVYTTASGHYSHAEGDSTTASGPGSHAEGYSTTASGDYSHASGFKAYIPDSDHSAYSWQGTDGSFSEPLYYSHGPGTFNLNPAGGLAGFWIGETNMAATLSGYATTGAVAAVQAEVADPWIDWSATITPINGTATVTRATGADPVLVLTDDVVISVPTTDWPTTGVSRVSLSLWAGTHSVTLLTNTVEYSSTPTISTNDWTTILFRRTGDQAKWKGVGL